MFALLECVCEPTLSHQTASIKPLQKCGPYMPMVVLIRAKTGYISYLLYCSIAKSKFDKFTYPMNLWVCKGLAK